MAERSRVIAVVNQKGGVGKTTTAVNLAACFAASERATLLVDLDPQGNASSAFGITNAERQVYDALVGQCVMKEAAVETALAYLHVVPAGPDLVGAEIELVSALSRERRLEAALSDLRDSYDVILIDCPPSLGLLTLNALTAADSILIPMQCEYYALEGLARLMDTVSLVKEHLNPRLELEGIVLTMVDMRNNLSRQVEAEVRGHFGDKVYRTRIPRNVRLSEAPSHGKPIILYDIQSSGAIAYLRLGEEVLAHRELAAPRKPPPPVGDVSGSSRAEPVDFGPFSSGSSPAHFADDGPATNNSDTTLVDDAGTSEADTNGAGSENSSSDSPRGFEGETR